MEDNYSLEECDLLLNSTDKILSDHFYVDYNRGIVTIGIPIVITLGLLGNLSFFFVLCRLRYMRNMTNLYLANLAFADVTMLIAASIQYFWSYAHSAPFDVSLIGYTFKTPFGCSAPNFLNYSCYFASIWFITLVATERYLAICHPLKHRMMRGKGRSARLIFLMWALSFVMGCLAAPYAGIDVICINGPSGEILGAMPRKISRCKPLCDECEKALWAIDTIQFFTALLCNTIMYAIIVYTLSIRFKPLVQGGSFSRESRRINRRNRDQVAKMLSINAIIFFLCLSPFMIINMSNTFHLVLINDFKNGIEWVARAAYLLNSAINPYIYSVLNRKYRQAFRQALGFGKSAQERQMSFLSRTSSVRISKRSSQNETPV